jgi:hypothetical protein
MWFRAWGNSQPMVKIRHTSSKNKMQRVVQYPNMLQKNNQHRAFCPMNMTDHCWLHTNAGDSQSRQRLRMYQVQRSIPVGIPKLHP